MFKSSSTKLTQTQLDDLAGFFLAKSASLDLQQIQPPQRPNPGVPLIEEGYRLIEQELPFAQKVANVLAHIGGPSGSGKTTILKRLSQQYPNFVTKDLDDFDQEGEQQLGFHNTRKKDYTDDMLKQLADKRQTLMDAFLTSNHDKQVVLGGHHWEDKHTLNIPTENRFRINTGPLRSAIRGYRRDSTRSLHELPYDYRINKEDISKLDSLGYQPKSPKEIFQFFKKP